MSDIATLPACRYCSRPLRHTFVDLGMSPLCQTHITAEQLNRMEPFYPLNVQICDGCFLVQLEEYVAPGEIFSEYAYFSSYAVSWVEHARRYAEEMRRRFGLGRDSMVVEVASNDGYLLQHFVAAGVPCYGIEPAANVARAAVGRGIPTVVEFLGQRSGERIAADRGQADLVLGNNVLAHVPDINDFVKGLKQLLKPRGIVTMEFPHLQRLIEENQFDTIYHEHYSYLSCSAVQRIFAANGLALFDVEELPTHGGSLRIYAAHAAGGSRQVRPSLTALLAREDALGFNRLDGYAGFGPRVAETKHRLLEVLIDLKREGRRIAGYGAPGKGNTLLNYCGIRTDFLDFTVDRNPYKQGKFTPGTHIPIHAPERLREERPDYVLILPWNLREEIEREHAYVRDWGGRFITPIPTVQIR